MTIFLVYVLVEEDHKLVPVEKWVNDHSQTIERLSGQEIGEKDFTDDRLGDVLGYLSDKELWSKIELELGRRTIRVYKLDSQKPIRLDATVGSVGHNPQKHPLFQLGRNKKGGYSVQFKLMLGVLDALGLVIASDLVAGSKADDPLYVPIYRRIRETLGAGKLYVGDCKMSSLDSRAEMEAGGDKYLMPLAMVGQSGQLLNELLELAEQGVLKSTLIYLPEDLPQEPNEEPEPELALAKGFEVVREQEATLADGSTIRWLERLFVVCSTSFANSQQETFEAKLAQAEAELEKLTPVPGRGKRQYDDEQKLQQAVDQILTKYKLSRYFTIELEKQVTIRQVQAYKDNPARTETKVRYQVNVTRNQEAIITATRRLGWRLYASNAQATQMSLQKAVLAYRDQYLAERPFARLKGKILNLLPLYVQLDDHATGLIHLLTIALRGMSLIEFVVQRSLAQNQETLDKIYDGNPKRQTARPSAELILKTFQGINLVISYDQEGLVVEQYLTPLTQTQLRILELSAFSVDIYHCLSDILLDWPLPQFVWPEVGFT